ncbi:MAG: VWA domain-containing protein [Chloroflexi bacterium]|jgi:Ca-activated chloride channel family protein|nr:VWA domain-containing protein [Chloroflexota bacterium]
MKKTKALLALLFTLWIVAHPMVTLADGIIIIDPPPSPPPDWEPWLTIRYHRVSVTIEDQVATTKVDQVFRNDGRLPAEGTYIFPLPPGAVIEEFAMWVEGQRIEGEVLPAEEARDIYEGYVRQQRDPALLEYVGRDAVRARIFPIPPGEERRIELTYTQILPVEDRLLYYRYPLDTERFSAQPLEQVSVHVTLSSPTALGAIYSPSHQDECVIQREGAHHATISYESHHIYPNRDFELYAGTDPQEIGATLLTHQPPEEDGYFLLLLSPSLPTEQTRVVPRDIFLVADTSGSMDGDKLAQTKDAMAYILQHLNPEDRFNVIAFSSGMQSYAPTLQPPSKVETAIDWIYGLEAIGGTNIYLALSEALAQADAERPAVIIFMTDGLPTEGLIETDTLLTTLAQEAPPSARIFPFGVGYDVNTLLLDQLAQEHKGRPAYVTPEEKIDEQVSTFYAQIQSPLLTDIALDFGDIQTYDVYPQPLPDLYASTQLIVTGRYRGIGVQPIELRGAVDGAQQVYQYEGRFQSEEEQAFIPRLWAARKIGHLLTQIRLHGENEEWIDAVVTLSLRYGIITPYTSFLIEEQEEALSTEGRKRAAEEFSALTPSAPSGQSAVEDAEMRLGLGGAGAAPAADESTPPMTEGDAGRASSSVQYVGDKTFLCDGQQCIDTAYVPDQMSAQEIVFMSETYHAQLAAHPTWANYFALGEGTIFVAEGGAAYRFVLGAGADDVPPPDAPTPTLTPNITPDPNGEEATPTPTEETTPTATTTPSQPSSVPPLCNGALALMLVSFVIERRCRFS